MYRIVIDIKGKREESMEIYGSIIQCCLYAHQLPFNIQLQRVERTKLEKTIHKEYTTIKADSRP